MANRRLAVMWVMLPIMALCAMCALGGCGSKAGKGPATAGTVEQLVNTTWATGQGTLHFMADGKVSFQTAGGVKDGTYLVSPEGIVRIFGVSPMAMAGTWDGKALNLMGQTLTQEAH